jgi:parallel beta-helix repeat protein
VCVTGATAGDVTMKAGVALVGQGGSVTGLVSVPQTAPDVTIRSLTLVGTGSSRVAPLQVNAARFQLLSSDLTNNHLAQSCITLGGDYGSFGRADDAVFTGNRVHDCGIDAMHDHGIYVEGASRIRLTHNAFTGNRAWGIQLYPDANSAYIGNNTITGNGRGLIYAGEGSAASDNNVVELNVIANSTLDSNVESYWGGTVGVGNVLRNNCIYSAGGGQPNVDTSEGGFSQSGTVGAGSCTGKGA